MIILMLIMCWCVGVVYVLYQGQETLAYEEQLIEKYQLPIRVHAIYLGVLVMKKWKLPYQHSYFVPFIRYGNIVFQDGSGEALHYLIFAKQVTFLLIGMPFVLVCLLWQLPLGVLSGMCLLLIVYNQRYRIHVMYRRKQEEMSKSLSQVLFQFVLLVSAGHTIMDAFDKVAHAKSGALYSEMQFCVQAIEKGASQIQALADFANRCDDKEIKRMVNLLMQTQQKGSGEMSRLFFEMSQINWMKEKTRVLQRAQNAATQLLLPSGLIFLGIIIMMMLPLLINGFLA